MTREVPRIAPSGPLAALKDGFVAWLTALGYVSTGLTGQLALLAHLDRWLDATGRGLGDLSPATLEQFLDTRRAEGHVTELTRHGLEPLVGYLGHLQLYASPVPKMTAADEVVGRFGQHLANERALGEGTANLYMHVARQFLAARPQPLKASLIGLAPGDVTGFILARSRRASVAAMQSLVSAMRALLRFLYVTGLTDRQLVSAVPTVARRREGLPRALSPEHVGRLLQGCDRTTAVGIRTSRS